MRNWKRCRTPYRWLRRRYPKMRNWKSSSPCPPFPSWPWYPKMRNWKWSIIFLLIDYGAGYPKMRNWKLLPTTCTLRIPQLGILKWGIEIRFGGHFKEVAEGILKWGIENKWESCTTWPRWGILKWGIERRYLTHTASFRRVWYPKMRNWKKIPYKVWLPRHQTQGILKWGIESKVLSCFVCLL